MKRSNKKFIKYFQKMILIIISTLILTYTHPVTQQTTGTTNASTVSPTPTIYNAQPTTINPATHPTSPPATQGQSNTQPIPNTSAFETAVVTKIIDGDTIQVNGNEKVRYIGMNSPEINSKQCYAAEAKQRNTELVLGKEIHMLKDVSDVDKYERKLRYIYLPDGTFVNKVLVDEGYAKILTIKPDIAYESIFKASEESAKEQHKGMWSVCPGL